MKFGLSTALGAGLLLAAIGVAQACGSGKSLLADSFDSLDPVWGESDGFMKVADGKMVIDEKDANFYLVFATPTFSEIDYCASVELAKGDDIAGSYGGLVFWGKDAENFYTFQITLDGYATVYVYEAGKWNALIEDKPAASIKQGLNTANELRVVTQGTQATLYINDAVFETLQGTPPAGGQHVGFTVEAPESGAASFGLDNVAVNEPAP